MSLLVKNSGPGPGQSFVLGFAENRAIFAANIGALLFARGQQSHAPLEIGEICAEAAHLPGTRTSIPT